MKTLSIIIRFIIAVVLLAGIVQATVAPVKTEECRKFYDGEGNEIPTHVVDLLVRSEFVFLDISDIDTLQRYFPLQRHICPFTLCPMIDQVRFHGCGACDEGSDCYALDAVHWDYPTLSYDECEDILFGTSKQNINEKRPNYSWQRQGVCNRAPCIK